MRYFSTDTLIQFLFVVPCVLIALTFHEFAHGYMAYKLGDPTAKNFGRLTLNPLKHLDPIGTICMIFFHFGWAKPVPINSRYFKKPRRDMALTAAAGPIMNFILALFGMLVCRILTKIFVAFPAQSDFVYYIQYAALTLFSYFHMLNLSLGVFNLIPIPPLDGSRIFYIFLPPKWYFGVMKYEKYIQLALLVLLWTGLLSRPLSAAVSWISGGMQWLVSWI
ncbi:MAG: site-2 protease family protein [Eubacteriales bacterium]|nr:site-2 protease family protein [Clostridia bacterium]MDY2845295.1 site-2 protease family protein [Eubacteriales bacterium]